VKVIGLILSFYLILLAAVPCCIIDNCPDDKTEQTASHENGDDDCGSCSPFFSCEGCTAATIAYQPAIFELISFSNSLVYTFHQAKPLPQVEYDFWQPPRIG